LHHAWSASTFLPYAWIDVFEGVGHVPQVEASEATIKAIEEFLRALPPPRALTTAPPPEPEATTEEAHSADSRA
jgi:hypothetical protein